MLRSYLISYVILFRLFASVGKRSGLDSPGYHGLFWPLLEKLRAVSLLADHRMATFGMKHAIAKRKKSDVEIEPYELTPYYLLYGNWKHIIGPLSKVQSSL